MNKLKELLNLTIRIVFVTLCKNEKGGFMSLKTKVFMMAFVMSVLVGFSQIFTLHGQEYYNVGTDEVNVETCKDFNALSDAQQEAWVDGYDTAVQKLVEEKEQDNELVDVNVLANLCQKQPKMDIFDALITAQGE